MYAVVRGTALKTLCSSPPCQPPPGPRCSLCSWLLQFPAPWVHCPGPCLVHAETEPPASACVPRVCGGQTALVLSTAISMCLLLPNSSLALPPLLTEELESRQVGWRASGQWSGVAGWVVGGCLSLGKWHRAGGHRVELTLVLLWPKCRTGP